MSHPHVQIRETPSLPSAAETIASASTEGRRFPLPELVAPAGSWECARAAVENGADAIYFGLDQFNARMRADNFGLADLPELMAFLHRRGVRGYLAFNTLVFADELPAAEQLLRAVIGAGVDAAIVQDVGVCRLIRQLSPDFPIRVSTQMTVTSAAGIEFARDLGCQAVVLARECSLGDIESIQGALGRLSPPGAAATSVSRGLPLEVFVHGALCVAYSGQCLTSEALGGRSANRGECAQACRLPYEFVADGKPVALGDRRYLLSPQDLASLEVLPDLLRLGVASLKIEGRLKTPEYVANITSVYRRTLERLAQEAAADTALASSQAQPADAAKLDESLHRLANDCAKSNRYDMEMAFSRGLYTGWFHGVNNQELVHGRFGKKRGVYLGTVRKVLPHEIHIDLQAPLKPGDGVVFDAGRPDLEEEGGRVYRVSRAGESTAVGFGRRDVDLSQVRPGNHVWKTSDPEWERRLRKSFESQQPLHRRPLHFQVSGTVGRPLSVTVRDEAGHQVSEDSTMLLEAADRAGLAETVLREQLGRLGNTPFRLGRLDLCLGGQVHLPLSELNRIRRELVERLERLRVEPRRWQLHPGPVQLGVDPAAVSRAEDRRPQSPELVVLVRNLAQLEIVLGQGVRLVYAELDDPKAYRELVRRFRAACPSAEADASQSPACEIWVAPPRVAKPGEDWILRQVADAGADGILVRNYDHLQYYQGQRCRGDYTLNVANPLAAEYFRRRFGLERLTVSYDLNAAQVEALLRAAPADWFEVTIHQHMPMFHMEHCVFCAFLSQGTDYRNCGRPCDRHEVQLQDRVGSRHPVRADAGCRNTVFNAVAQTGAEYFARFRTAGARRFRVEFLSETSEEIVRTLSCYRRLLRGEMNGSDLWRELRLVNRLGVTRGPLEAAPARM